VLYVTGTGGEGVSLRQAPSGTAERLRVVPEGAALQNLNEERQSDGRGWRRVRDTDGQEGWVASEFLTTDAVAAFATATAVAQRAPPAAVEAAEPAPTAARPTGPLPELRPTFTPVPRGPGAPAPQSTTQPAGTGAPAGATATAAPAPAGTSAPAPTQSGPPRSGSQPTIVLPPLATPPPFVTPTPAR
jgi:hypothetical protein